MCAPGRWRGGVVKVETAEVALAGPCGGGAAAKMAGLVAERCAFGSVVPACGAQLPA